MDQQINEFQFYKKLMEPLILYTPQCQERYLAAAWLKKLEDPDIAEESLRLSYLKLLFLSLQRNKLIGIFADNPASYKSLIDFRKDFDVHEFAKCMIEKSARKNQEDFQNQLHGKCEYSVPVYIEYSSSLQEYAAAQDIPNFGVHSYYAFSKEPMTKWKKFNQESLPKETAHKLPKSTCFCTDEAMEKQCLMEKLEKSGGCRVLRPSVPLLGVECPHNPPYPPTWGSNIHGLQEDATERKRRPYANKL